MSAPSGRPGPGLAGPHRPDDGDARAAPRRRGRRGRRQLADRPARLVTAAAMVAARLAWLLAWMVVTAMGVLAIAQALGLGPARPAARPPEPAAAPAAVVPDLRRRHGPEALRARDRQRRVWPSPAAPARPATIPSPASVPRRGRRHPAPHRLRQHLPGATRTVSRRRVMAHDADVVAWSSSTRSWPPTSRPRPPAATATSWLNPRSARGPGALLPLPHRRRDIRPTGTGRASTSASTSTAGRCGSSSCTRPRPLNEG